MKPSISCIAKRRSARHAPMCRLYLDARARQVCHHMFTKRNDSPRVARFAVPAQNRGTAPAPLESCLDDGDSPNTHNIVRRDITHGKPRLGWPVATSSTNRTRFGKDQNTPVPTATLRPLLTCARIMMIHPSRDWPNPPSSDYCPLVPDMRRAGGAGQQDVCHRFRSRQRLTEWCRGRLTLAGSRRIANPTT